MTQTNDTPTPTHASDRLEQSLQGLIGAHERLIELTQAHRQLIAQANANALPDVVTEQHEVIKQIGMLEQQRRQAVRELVGGMGRRAPQPTMASVLERLAAPLRDRVGRLAEQLRGLLSRLTHEREIVRRATMNLVGHMEGLMRQVAASLSQSGTYERSGRVEAPGQPIAAGIDLTS